jgi:maleylacetoacetate isomerase
LLELKNIPYDLVPINLLTGQQRSEEYLSLNPNGSLPMLTNGQWKISQSVAIMEYLEEVHQDPNFRLLPADPLLKSKVRALVQLIVADTQPLQNMKVLKKLMEYANKTDAEVRDEWGTEFIHRGLTTFQQLVSGSEEITRYSVGDQITLADIALIPQLYNGTRFGIDVAVEFPRLIEIEQNFKADFPEAHAKAYPDAQIDSPTNAK